MEVLHKSRPVLQSPPVLRELRHELHEICQPLTALQCRLELGRMMGDAVSLTEAVADAGVQVQRIFDCVARMRTLLAAADETLTGTPAGQH